MLSKLIMVVCWFHYDEFIIVLIVCAIFTPIAVRLGLRSDLVWYFDDIEHRDCRAQTPPMVLALFT